MPSAVAGETDRLSFQVSALSGKGLLSQQTREALRTLLQKNHSSTILKLRAFVAGSGDMRRIAELVGETWTDKHLPLPALSVVQTGGLPLEGAQVLIESVAEEKHPVNPNGVAFLSGQAAENLEQSLNGLAAALNQSGMENSDMLRVTCYVRWLDENKDAQRRMTEVFPNAAAIYVQTQREYVTPVAECEGVARQRSAPVAPVKFTPGSANYSPLALVSAPRLVLTGTQRGFGTQDNDIRLAFERLQKAVGAFNTKLDRTVMSHIYLTSRSFADKVRAVRSEYYGNANPPASTILPFEGLPSLDASFGVDVIAVAGSTAP